MSWRAASPDEAKMPSCIVMFQLWIELNLMWIFRSECHSFTSRPTYA